MAKATRRIKGKKKRWFQIIAPKAFKEQILGEAYLYEPSSAIGRPLKINLMNLTGDIKRQNINIRFRINSAKEGKLYAGITGYEIMTTAIKRMVRRRSSKILLSFTIETSDNKQIRIKPVILTRGRVKQSILTKLRKTAEELIREEAKKSTYEKMLDNIVNHKLQTDIKKHLKKIHPIRVVEIKELFLKQKKELEKPKAKTVKTSG